ncbi:MULTISPECIES: phosphotransferase family protein [Frankia]|uniref:phosphotransferase family protein n=1 Tax=Frankia TaxID=1854 RepID=UPI0009FEBDFA|nr:MULTISPECIES: phosphotransferase family protein [Frankia]
MAASDARDTELKDDGRVIAWLESLLGGQVVSWERQPRWRPMWFVDIDRGGVTERVVVRGERSDTSLIFPLEHEMLFQRLLDEHGVPVPRVHGWCDEPRAYAMAAVPGRPDFAGTTDDERHVVVDEYLQALARMHQLPVEPFKAAGVISGTSPSDSAMIGVRRFEQHYRSSKTRPDPLMEFVLGWLRRHPLPASDREAPIVWDSGQFHHADGHLVALVDVEIGHIGDPMMDLAAWRMRDTVIPYGEFPVLYDRYAELTGRPVDLAAIQWHHLFFTLTNQLSFHGPLARPTLDTDYMTYAQWVSETNLHAVETMAEYLGIDLEPVEIPEPVSSPVSIPHQHLSRSLRSISVEDPYVTYQIRIAFRLARHLERADQIGAAVTEADREDLARLVGRAPKSWDECETALENFVLADEGRHDAELVVLFNRRWQRYKALMGPAGSAMAAHHTMQPFGRWLG